jgi:hypothetical protein
MRNVVVTSFLLFYDAFLLLPQTPCIEFEFKCDLNLTARIINQEGFDKHKNLIKS